MSAFSPPARLLSELVSIESPSGGESACAELSVECLAGAGVEVERVGASVIARVGSGAPRVLFNTHLDTVPVGEGWDGDPFDGTWRDGRLVARGANDAKASVAAMITAAADFAAGTRPAGTLLLALTAGEETSNAGMGAVLAHLKTRGEAPDGGVTGEPTGLEVVRAQSGLAVLEALWTGRACHAAHVARVEHASALAAAARELAQLPPWFELEGEHPLLGKSTLVATVLTAGERHNQVPDRAVCVFDGRLAPPHTAADCARLLRSRLPAAEIRVRSERLKPVETAADHPLVAAALAATGRAAGVGSGTMSDMALLAGVPAVKCGPGQTVRSHTPNEYVLEHEFQAGCEAYRALIPLALEALA